MEKLRAGILGATGMVGQRFVKHLAEHPWFEVVSVAASSRSAGMTYAKAVFDRWTMDMPIPDSIGQLILKDAETDLVTISREVDLVFCAVDMPADKIRRLEEEYAKREIVVVSANSAHRWTPDVPMIIPEVNPGHAHIIPAQRRRLGTKRGFVAVKPNCAGQGFISAITPLLLYKPRKITAATYQAISGAGKTFATWREMNDNVIPFIANEEVKTKTEPLKIWGGVTNDSIQALPREAIQIEARCVRVPVSDGHMAIVWVEFEEKPTYEQITRQWNNFRTGHRELQLPSAPKPFLNYQTAPDFPHAKICREPGMGMTIHIGGLQVDQGSCSFACLAHNLDRGAAGGAILMAELLQVKGFLD